MTGVEHSNRETAGVAGHVMLPGKDGAARGFFGIWERYRILSKR